jgi:hypothetical protein
MSNPNSIHLQGKRGEKRKRAQEEATRIAKRRSSNRRFTKKLRARKKKELALSTARLLALEKQRVYADMMRAETTQLCVLIHKNAIDAVNTLRSQDGEQSQTPLNAPSSMSFLKEACKMMALIADLALQVQQMNSDGCLPCATKQTEEKRALD